jgi:hypothetical protein
VSIEVVLHPKSASREQLRDLLTELRFAPTEHLWDWPEGSVHYRWFDRTDYRSFDGVEATIYQPSDDEDIKQLGLCTWALHTRTRASASPADKEQQNNLIRIARQKFGGNFYNDWFGKNRYTSVPPDRRDAAARGMYIAYEFVRANITAVKFALPEPVEGFEKFVSTKLNALSTQDPTRVLYNALVPFAVAALEHFFSQCFKILLKYEPRARERLELQTRKVDLAEVLAIESGTKTIEDIVADWYSFQNIASIHRAFSDWFGIDFWKLLRRRRKIGKRLPILEKQFNDLIQFRHGIVHGLSVDNELRKQQIQEILDLALAVIDTFVDYLEKARGKPIREE